MIHCPRRISVPYARSRERRPPTADAPVSAAIRGASSGAEGAGRRPRHFIFASREPLAGLRTKSTRGKPGPPRRKCGCAELGISKVINCPRLPRYREPRRGWAWSYFTLAGSSNRPSMDCGRIVLPSSIARRPLSVVSFPSRGLGPRLQTHEEHRGCCEARQSNLRRRKRLGGLDFIGIFARPTTRVWTFVEPCTVRYTGPPMGQRQQTHVPTGHRQLPVWGAKPCGKACTETSPRPFPL